MLWSGFVVLQKCGQLRNPFSREGTHGENGISSGQLQKFSAKLDLCLRGDVCLGDDTGSGDREGGGLPGREHESVLGRVQNKEDHVSFH